jgi:hypothetical protein
MNRTILFRAGLLALVISTITIGAAVATPGGSVVAAPVHARGVLDGRQMVNTKDLLLLTRTDVEVITQSITIGPGGHTGWHSHPGPVLVTVTAGELTIYYAADPECDGTTYGANDTFIDKGGNNIHIARNEGLSNLTLWATYLVPVGTPFRTDVPDPGTCPF